MILSDEQMSAARSGCRPKVEPTWSLVDLPVGPQPLPTWIKGLHVDFMDAYGNAPHIRLKVCGNVRRWPEKRYTQQNTLYLAEHPDGRAEAYYQQGTLRPAVVKRWRSPDGSLHVYARQKPRNSPSDKWELEDGGAWVEVTRPCTPQQEGFGGSHYDITLTDGTEITLRGPWHGGAPEGFIEAAYLDATESYSIPARHFRPWFNRGGFGGLFLREELFIRIFARFVPHFRLARVLDAYGPQLQPLKPEWDAPKAWMLDRARRSAA